MGRKIEQSLCVSKVDGPSDENVRALGWLSFLASFCPLHRNFPQHGLARLFIPAINNDCVRFFKNDDGAVCAALIWARLSDDVSKRMLFDRVPPDAAEWDSGNNLWFLDLLAPFKHGRMIAQKIVRDQTEEPFYFARLDKEGAVRKVVRVNTSNKIDRVNSFFIDKETGRVR